MNISELLKHTLQHYDAMLQLIDNQTIRIHQQQEIPDYLLDLLRKYKPQLIRHLQLESAYTLLQTIQREGAEIQIINGQDLRLNHAEYLESSDIHKLKQLKVQIIEILNTSNNHHFNSLDQYVQYEIIQVYFDRLERHRNNLRKINNAVENALVRPKDLLDDLGNKFALNPQQTDFYLTSLLNQDIFFYENNSKFYLFPNFNHTAMQAFQQYDYATLAKMNHSSI